MFKIKIIGAGQLGSRHLQALRLIKEPLDIQVIDPSVDSLKIAKERYESFSNEIPNHKISFINKLVDNDTTDIAVIATNSNVRQQAIKNLFSVSKIKFLIMEKLLFNNKDYYKEIEQLLSKFGAKAWVNCSMRVMPVYNRIKLNLSNKPILYRVTGGQFGLVTNAIHYIDHLAYLTGCEEFAVDTSDIEPIPILSKRPGFMELNGTLRARFVDGSVCGITCHPSSFAPVVVEIFDEKNRYIIKESEGKLWCSSEDNNWLWVEEDAPIPYQSQMTTKLIESLLNTGECALTPYSISAKIHLQMLDPLLEVIRKYDPTIITYPFT